MNTSLSGRVQRRNAVGFKGEGTSSGWKKTTSYGDYKNDIDAHKLKDKDIDKIHKNLVGFTQRDYKLDATGNIMYIGRKVRCMSKKYADNHQKLTH